MSTLLSSYPIYKGGNKDKGSANACGLKDRSNYGWRDPNAEFRSIMANDCSPGQCDSMPKNGCARVQRFSNTEHLYNGIAMGSPAHDNASHLNKVKKEVAEYKQTRIPTTIPVSSLNMQTTMIQI